MILTSLAFCDVMKIVVSCRINQAIPDTRRMSHRSGVRDILLFNLLLARLIAATLEALTISPLQHTKTLFHHIDIVCCMLYNITHLPRGPALPR